MIIAQPQKELEITRQRFEAVLHELLPEWDAGKIGSAAIADRLIEIVAADAERHQLLNQADREHAGNLQNEIGRHERAIDHIERVYRERVTPVWGRTEPTP